LSLASRRLYNILYVLWLYNEFFIILYNIKKIAELDCCQIIILSIYISRRADSQFNYFSPVEYLKFAKSVNIRDKKKITIFRGKERKRYFNIHRRPIFIPDWKSWPLININVIFNHISIIFIELIGRSNIFQFYLHHGKFCNSSLRKIVHIPASPKQSQGWTICSSHFARTMNIYTCKQWNNGRHVR
jgi:hypothetical protein